MQANDLIKLQASLCDAISEWIEEQSIKGEEWNSLCTHISDNVAELMASSAFNILLSQKNLTDYYKEQEMLKE